MRTDVRMPATFKHAYDLHTGSIAWYDAEGKTLGGASRMGAVVGDLIEVRFELTGMGRLVYLEMVVTVVGGRDRAGLTEFEFGITRFGVDERAAFETWLRNRAARPSAPAPRVNPAPREAGPSPYRASLPRVDAPRAPEAPRTVQVDAANRTIVVRWSRVTTFFDDWAAYLNHAGFLVPVDPEPPARGTTVTVTLHLPDDTTLTVPGTMAGHTGAHAAVNLSLSSADRERLRVLAQKRKVPSQVRAAR